ncbi:hypothetical protein HanIR_Chr03g0125701 [Helianthus annuus]|nr:hypothetical protein HanIR_Chr03g0125701 [Helianthus annuus]
MEGGARVLEYMGATKMKVGGGCDSLRVAGVGVELWFEVLFSVMMIFEWV